MTVAPGTGNFLLAKIRDENLNVYRASPQRLREDVGQENQIALDYRGRLIYELLQNADDAMATEDAGAAHIRFMLTDDALWVGNSGRPLNEADVRGLCGISASSKVSPDRRRRATIGHKGMGFKSVLEITDAPEVFSTSLSFRFGPDQALRAVQALVDDGIVPPVSRAPITRFPWPIEGVPAEWSEMRAAGMRTAFRFPLRARMTAEQRTELAEALINLPVTTLIFLKHFRRVEIAVRTGDNPSDVAWTVGRERLAFGCPETKATGCGTGTYRVTLRPDHGDPQEFLLAHDGDIAIGKYRAGLDEYSWEGVECTEVSVAARLDQGRPIPLVPGWRKLHVFLPSGEQCPYDILVSAAFSSNVSRQEIRIEPDELNYNRFLLRGAAGLLRDQLIPALLGLGATVGDVLRLFDRGARAGAPEPTAAAQALYEEVRAALMDLPFVPQEDGPPLAPASCVVPPLVQDADVGRAFRAALPVHASWEGRSLPNADHCGSDSARVLVDHGALAMTPAEAAAVLASVDDHQTRAREVLERGIWVDPVLDVLERLWRGFAPSCREEFATVVRSHPLCPGGIRADGTVHRIAIEGLECFYPPRSLQHEVPLDGLCFLARDLCWGALTPRERNIELKDQMEAWQALFGAREFKFPDVMRASVLPALELERSTEGDRVRGSLHNLDRLAAICQLAGRTPNRNAPLPYERLGSNRALFNLSRLDVPCRKYGDDRVVWMPAYRVYFGDNWIGESSIEWVLFAGEEMGEAMPDVHLLLEPAEFAGLLDRYRHLKDVAGSDQGDVGADEVSLDEDEEAALASEDHTRWLEFFAWLGVNGSLRPVHFHDVEDRASGWLRTEGLKRPEGWAFKNIPEPTWSGFADSVRRSLSEKNSKLFSETTPYFYRLHDLEHLGHLLEAAARDATAQLGRALYEHLAHNWAYLERFARLQVAQIQGGSPARRSKPQTAYDHEVAQVGDDFWVRRLQQAWFCPTGHGPRAASQVWLPTPEVQRRFGTRTRQGVRRYLVPALDVDAGFMRGKGRAFAQTLGIHEELTPATFTVEDARVVLTRLHELYAEPCAAGVDLRSELREVIRPAYRHLLELLSNRERPRESRDPAPSPLVDAPVLAQDGTGILRFAPAREVFYAERRETRDRLRSGDGLWTFVIEAQPGARAPLIQLFGMRNLEEALHWTPEPGEPSLSGEELDRFRAGLQELVPYLLARVGAERTDERLLRRDTQRLRRFIEIIEPVTHLKLGCALDGRSLGVEREQRLAYVELGEDRLALALVVWGEHPWPPTEVEAEALAAALGDILGAGFFESFLALIQAGSAAARVRLLRRAGAPSDVDEWRALLQGDALDDEVPLPVDQRDVKSAAPVTSTEDPARSPDSGPCHPSQASTAQRTPLFTLDELLIDGHPVQRFGPGAPQVREVGRSGQIAFADLQGQARGGGYGGHTDLDALDRLGMEVALIYERQRLRRAGLATAEILDWRAQAEQPDALVFDVSSPDRIVRSRSLSPRFDAVMCCLQKEFGVSPEWPGFDLMSLDPREGFDRLIELKSSGVDARVQEMTWNEWKVAAGALRSRFFLYLVGNLRSDLRGTGPFVRTVQDPFGQLAVEVRESRTVQRKVQLAVRLFQEAEDLSLTVVPK